MFDHLPAVSRRVLLSTAPLGLYRVRGAAIDRGPRYSPVEDAVVSGTWVLLARVMREPPATAPNQAVELLETRKDGLTVVVDYSRVEDAEFYAEAYLNGTRPHELAKALGERRGAKVETA